MVNNTVPNLSVGATGGSLPAQATLVGGTNAGTFRALAVDGSGNLGVNVSAASVDGVIAHDGAITGVEPVLIGGFASTAAPTAVSADGDSVWAWLDRQGRVQIGDGGGNISIDDGGNSITVDGAVTVTAGSGFAAVATAGSAVPATGYMAYGSDGTNARAQLTDTAGRQINVGAVAHDGVAAGNPLLIGAYASTTAPTAVSAAGDVTQLWADLNGRLQIGDGGGNISIDDGGGSITVDGAVNVTASSGFPAVATAGSAVPATGLMAYGSDGTNARALLTTSTGILQTLLPQASTGTHTVISVTTTATSLLAANSARKGFMLINNDTAGVDVFLGFSSSVTAGTAAGANRGGMLSSFGGSCSMSTFAGYTGALFGITAASTALVCAMEW